MKLRLNDKGFGTKDMIIYTCVILFFLILADLLILSFYKKQDRIDMHDLVEEKPVDKSKGAFYIYYQQQESNLKVAGLSYARDKKLNAVNDFTISIGILKDNNYIKDIRDSEDNTICSGYVVIKNTDYDYDVKPYIKCNSYTTDGY